MPSTLPTFSLARLDVPDDVLVVFGVVVAVVAGLLFINLGLLLPGLLTGFSGHDGRRSAEYQEFGPAQAPVISEPAPVVRHASDRSEVETTVVLKGTRRQSLSWVRSGEETGHAR